MANKLETAGRQAYQGLTFGFGDELIDVPTAAIVAALTGQKYKDVLKEAREISKKNLAKDWEENTAISLAANIAGGVPFGLAGAGKNAALKGAGSLDKASKALKLDKYAAAITNAGKNLSDWASAGGRLARAAKTGAAGAGYGAVAGLGAGGDTAEDRVSSALLGSVIGGTAGSVGGGLSRSSPTVQSVAPKAAKSASQNRAENEFLRQLLMRPDLPEMQKRMAEYQALSGKTGIELTLPEMLAQTDVDPLLAQQAVLAKSPETAGAAQSLLQRRMGDPLAGQSGQITGAMRNLAGSLAQGSYDDLAQGVMQSGKKAAGDISKRIQAQARPLYEQAEGVLVDPNVFKDPVVKQAVDAVFKNPAYMREITPETAPNSVKVLDLAYKAIRDQAAELGSRGNRNAARLYGDAAEALVNKMDEAAPAYRQARQIYSSQPEILQNRELMGELANIDQLSPERVIPQLYGGTVGTAQRTAAALGEQGSRQAAAAKIQDIIGGLKAGSLPPRLDEDTINMLKVYSGKDAGMVQDFLRTVERARAGERFLRGSQTSTNQAIEKGMGESAANAALDLASGNKIGLMRQGLGAVSDVVKGGSKEQYNRDLLNMFTTPRGIEAVNEAVKTQQRLMSIPASTAQLPASAISGSGITQSIQANRNYTPNPLTPTISTIPAATQFSQQLPPGFVIQGQQQQRQELPQGFIIQGGQ